MVDNLDGGLDKQNGTSQDDSPKTETALAANPNTEQRQKHESRTKKLITITEEWVRFAGWPWIRNKAWPTVKRAFTSSTFWTALATVAIAVLTGYYTYYARKQWQAMSGQLDTMNGQLAEMQKQRRGLSARLEFKNFKWDAVNGQTIISFDVFNEGGSEAREIANGGRDDPGGVPPFENEDLMTPGGPFSGGPTVPQGKLVEHVEIRPPKDTHADPRTKSPEWYAYRKYTYIDIFGDIQESCGLIMPHKGRFYLWQCPPRKEQKNAD